MIQEEQEKFTEEIEDPIREAHWPKVLFYTYLQILTFYGVILIFTGAYSVTSLFCFTLILLGVLGVTAGAHRLWAHNSYTATTSLKIFLMICQTLAGQGSIYNWVLYHRLHHKHFGTDQDPYNPNKGFFYSHFLCLMQKSPPEQEELAKNIDMSDLEEDKVVMFQKKYYWILFLIFCAILPIFIPMAYWKESLLHSAVLNGWMRYGITLHFAWLVHSAITIFGLKKGEKYPSDTNMVFLLNKTYWLSYHYIAPWDYQTSEYGKYSDDWITTTIRVFAALQLATNLRTTDCVTVQTAVYNAMKTKKPITECLLESEANINLPKDHYLEPKT